MQKFVMFRMEYQWELIPGTRNIEERFAWISYGREEIVKYVMSNDGKPCFVLEVSDWRWKQRIHYASSYYQWGASARRAVEETTRDPLYNYYKCFLCKKITWVYWRKNKKT